MRADVMLLGVAIIFGTGFVAQRLGSDALSAFAFTGLRFTIGALLLLPMLRFAPWPTHTDRATVRRATLRSGLFAGVVMLLASLAQQYGLASTSASNGAFITSLYVVFVPLLGLLTRQRIGWPVWLGVSQASDLRCSVSLRSSPSTLVIRGFCCARCCGQCTWWWSVGTRATRNRFDRR